MVGYKLRTQPIESPQRVSHDEPRGVLLRRSDTVFEIEDDAVRTVKGSVQHELRLRAGQIETRAPEATFRGRLSVARAERG